MKKNRVGLLLILTVVTLSLQYCSSAEKITEESFPPISYAQDLRPIMLRSCTPCHFPEKGRKEMLDTYEKTVANIDSILVRVQLPSNNKDYMPFKSKRPALSEQEIAMFMTWKAQGMTE